MDYKVVNPKDLDSMSDRPSKAYSITNAGELQNMGVRLYEANPGEQVPLRYHYHEEQEELFFVLKGVLSVETPKDEFAINEGEFFIVKPGNPHRSYCPQESEQKLRVLAIGAPNVDDGHGYEPE